VRIRGVRAGLRDAVAVVGAPVLTDWQERFVLTDQKPDDTGRRLRGAIENPTADSTDDANELLQEILDLADAHNEGADTRAARFALRLRP
jgi:hypothetical protein